MHANLFIDHITEHCGALWEHSTKPLVFEGVDGSRVAHEREAKRYRRQLEALLKEYPRKHNDSETAEAWVERIRMEKRDTGRLLGMIGRLYRIIERMDDEAELERRKRADAEKEEQKQRLAYLRKQATPDEAEVERLKALVESAKAHEELLANLFEAYANHRVAQEARKRLAAIFDQCEQARDELARNRETVAAKAIKRAKVADAPAGAIQFAREVERVNKLLPFRQG
jgi:hypothetical protein